MLYSEKQQQTLIHIARQAISYGLKHHRPPELDVQQYEPKLRQKRATFVTLHHSAQLRGCIGSLEPTRALAQDVASHAFAAAFNDPRFLPLAEHELTGLDINISILSDYEAMHFHDEEDLLGQLRPTVDGLILEDPAQNARGTFLPAVWMTLPNRKLFWRQLKKKANLSEDHWSDTLRVWRYTTESIKSSDVG